MKNLILLLALIALPAHGQINDHPSRRQGLGLNTGYEPLGLDTINLYNGNLSLAIPLGHSYPIGPNLSFQVMLYYNSNVWNYVEETNGSVESQTFVWDCTNAPLFQLCPDLTGHDTHNAGAGWRLSLSEVWGPDHLPWNADPDHHVLVEADGTRRFFYTSLHPNEPFECLDPVTPGTNWEDCRDGYYYTRDGSYLRARFKQELSGGRPDFNGGYVERPNGLIYCYDIHGRLASIDDRWGWQGCGSADHDLTVDRSVIGRWLISDRHNRSHTFWFRDDDADIAAGQVDFIDLVAFGGATARYRFTYFEALDGNNSPINLVVEDPIQPADPEPTDPPATEEIPALVGLELADDAQNPGDPLGIYEFSYYTAQDLDAGLRSGSLSTMKLPTKGFVAWEYGVWDSAYCGAGPFQTTGGVKTRRAYDRGGTILSEHSYEASALGVAALSEFDASDFDPDAEQVIRVATSPIGLDTAHYFYAGHAGVPFCALDEWQNALPFGREASGTLRLSSEVFDGKLTASGSPPLMRKNWVEYTADPGADHRSGNQRLLERRTEYLDDPGAATWLKFSMFDGLGNFRRVETDAVLFHGENEQVQTTDFNPGKYYDCAPDPEGSTCVGGGAVDEDGDPVVGVVIASSEPWILNLYDSVEIVQGTEDPIVREACFDKDTGFLLATRLRGPARERTDLIELSTPNSEGFRHLISSYGGDVNPIPSASVNDSICDLNTALAGTSPEYQTENIWQYGVLKRSRHVGADYWDYRLDDVFGLDPTGLPAKELDMTGILATDYVFDRLGRLLQINPSNSEAIPEDAATEIVHTQAEPWSGANPGNGARTVVELRPGIADGTVLSRSTTYADGQGRLEREERLLPPAVGEAEDRVLARHRSYSALGQALRVSEWGVVNQSGGGNLLGGGGSYTEFDYADSSGQPDFRGRPLFVYPADYEPGTQTYTHTKLTYTGDRRIERKSRIATSSAAAEDCQTASEGEQCVNTTEYYDQFGRLVQVDEQGGLPNSLIATYRYDALGNLTEAKTRDSTTSQTRLFDVDGRGLVICERHPEKGGVAGNGWTRYLYDSRGNVRRSYELSSHGQASCPTESSVAGFERNYRYDAGGRLELVEDGSAPRRPLVELFYYGHNPQPPGQRRQPSLGKLSVAIRHNYRDLGEGLEDLKVTESYTYGGRNGRVSERRTTLERGGAFLANWTQGFSYTPLGDIDVLTYPCRGVSCADAATLDYSYDGGWLSAIENVASFSYHDNGQLSELRYTNGLISTRGKDPNNIGRPASISWDTGSSSGGGTLSYDGSGNVKAFGLDTYEYDHVGRLSKHALASGAEQSFEYDAYGNLTRKSRALHSASLGTTVVSASRITNRLDGGGSTYDVAGNLTNSPAGVTLAYDGMGMLAERDTASYTGPRLHIYTADDERLATIPRSGLGTVSIRDLGGRLLSQYSQDLSIPGTGTIILADGFESGDTECWSTGTGPGPFGGCSTGAEPVEVTSLGSASGWERNFFHGGGFYLGRHEADGARFFNVPDWLGTPVRVFDDSLAEDKNLVFGYGEEQEEEYGAGHSFDSPLLYTAHERDRHGGVDVDLDYMHSRHLWPLYGRFVSPDLAPGQVASPQSWNRYAYVTGNPATYVDPLGLFGVPGIAFTQFAGGVMAQRAAGIGALLGTLPHELPGVGVPTLVQRFRTGVSAASIIALNVFLIGEAMTEHALNDPIMSELMLGMASGGFGTSWRLASVAMTTSRTSRAAGSIDDLVRAAQARHPSKAGKIEYHHIVPKYLGGDPKGRTVPIDAAYHQDITNAFREFHPYGSPLPSPERLEETMRIVYERYPLPW